MGSDLSEIVTSDRKDSNGPVDSNGLNGPL